jgi:hypothetical protein
MNTYKSNKPTYTKQIALTGQKASTSADVKKPTTYVGSNTFRSKDGKFKTSASGPRPATSNRTNNYGNRPSSDSKGNPLCFKCGEVRWARDCPNHAKMKVFAIGMGDEHPSDTTGDPEGDTNEPSGDPPEGEILSDDEENDRLVEDPYNPQHADISDTEDEGEADNGISFGPLSFVAADEDNYVLKLASSGANCGGIG